jgi:dipeptidyl aminopeptidase/acylaminoacyl peptidase
MSIGRDGEQLKTVIGEGGVVSSFSFDNAFHRLAYLFGKMDDPCQIYVREVENDHERQVTKVGSRVQMEMTCKVGS